MQREGTQPMRVVSVEREEGSGFGRRAYDSWKEATSLKTSGKMKLRRDQSFAKGRVERVERKPTRVNRQRKGHRSTRYCSPSPAPPGGSSETNENPQHLTYNPIKLY